MVHKEKDLFDLTITDLCVKLEDTQSLLSLTRDFSANTSTHIKIMANLINNLIQSDDSLALEDREIVAYTGNNTARSISSFNDQHVEMSYSSGNDNLVETLVSGYKRETEKLWSRLKGGEENLSYMKMCLERLMSDRSNRTMTSSRTNGGSTQRNVNNINVSPEVMNQTMKNGFKTEYFKHTVVSEKNIETERKVHRREASSGNVTERTYRPEKSTMSKHKRSSVESPFEEYGDNTYKIIDQLNSEIKKLKADNEVNKNRLNDSKREVGSMKAKHKAEIDEKDSVIRKLVEQLQTVDSHMRTMDEEVTNLKLSRSNLDRDTRYMLRDMLIKTEEMKDMQYKGGFDIANHLISQKLDRDVYEANVDLTKRIKDLEVQADGRMRLEAENRQLVAQIDELNEELKLMRDENINLLRLMQTSAFKKDKTKASMPSLLNEMRDTATGALKRMNSLSLLSKAETDKS